MKQYLKKKSKWTEISKKLKGRNIYAIKNRIHSLCNKFQIPKSKKDMEEAFSKLVEEEIETFGKKECLKVNFQKKIHCENMDNGQKIIKKKKPIL